MKNSRLLAISCLITGALFAVPHPAGAEIHEVIVRNFEFSPQFLTVEEGDIVRWVWESGNHTTTSGDPETCTPDGLWSDPMTMSDSEFEFQFDDPGEYPYYCIPHCASGMNGAVSVNPVVGVEDGARIAGLILKANYPNPIATRTTIAYELPVDGTVRLSILDAAGRLIRSLVSGVQAAGGHEIEWDAADAAGDAVASGVYFTSLRFSDRIETRRIVLIR